MSVISNGTNQMTKTSLHPRRRSEVLLESSRWQIKKKDGRLLSRVNQNEFLSQRVLKRTNLSFQAASLMWDPPPPVSSFSSGDLWNQL